MHTICCGYSTLLSAAKPLCCKHRILPAPVKLLHYRQQSQRQGGRSRIRCGEHQSCVRYALSGSSLLLRSCYFIYRFCAINQKGKDRAEMQPSVQTLVQQTFAVGPFKLSQPLGKAARFTASFGAFVFCLGEECLQPVLCGQRAKVCCCQSKCPCRSGLLVIS